MDYVVAPALPAQAIGRLGNWFNQELFGLRRRGIDDLAAQLDRRLHRR